MSGQHVSAKAGIGHSMREDAISEAARSDHPPIESDTGDQTNVPKGPVLGSEKDRCNPERLGLVSAQADPVEPGRNQPAH